LATGDTFKTIAFSYRLGRKTVADIVREVCSALWTVLQPLVMPVPTTEKWCSIANDFEALWQFPNCLGAIDGKHVVIEKPANSGSLFFNYKKDFSVVLLAVVDANYKFIAVDVGAYGKSSDGGIFRSSSFGKKFLRDKLNIPKRKKLPRTNKFAPYVLIGDSGFPLLPTLMRPFPQNKVAGNDGRKIFNYRLSRARRVSENAFGILSKRFRVYQRKIQLTTEIIDIVILATCVLHNYLCDKSNKVLEEKIFEEENVVTQNQRPMRSFVGIGGACSKKGMKIRRLYTQYFNSKAGEVPWQYEKIRTG
jgi:hypothetical protein